MEELNKIIRDKNKLLTVAGILHSSRAFCAPEVLHVDLTNWCNFNCIACWCRSPLLGDKAMSEEEKKLILPLDLLKSIFDDITEMGGLRQVKLVGGGEPFMHPDILKVVEYIKKKDSSVEIDINTNFSLVDQAKADRLFELGVDSLTVSLWAGSEEAYAAVHPNQTGETFLKIKKVLKFILERKKQLKTRHPRIIIHDVILKLNYHDVEEMLNFGLEIGADNIQFVPVDPINGKTDNLLLDDTEKKELLERLYLIKKRYDPESLVFCSKEGKSVVLPDFDGFIRRIQELNISTGAYDEAVVDEFPCYVGWLFARIMTTGNVVPCCKGHRLSLGNVFKDRFRDIWFSEAYNQFRYNGLHLSKSDPYFSKIGNDADAKTGCYNCDNLWQNMPMHRKISSLKGKKSQLISFCGPLLKNLP